MPPVIAIDGPAASGKSTTAHAVAAALGWTHLDTGAVYRAITLAALDHLSESEWGEARVRNLAVTLPVRVLSVDDRFRVEVAGVDVGQMIRSERVTAAVSRIASLPAVREWATGAIRSGVAACRAPGVVVDGRDIGSVVFPESPVKVFLTAAPRERARRRLGQRGQAVDAQELERETAILTARDTADRSRSIAPLRAAPGAVTLDTTSMDFRAQVERIITLAHKHFA